MKRVMISGVFAILGMAGSSSAFAATANTTLGISATVQNACVVSSSDLAFGTYNPTASSATDGTGSVSVTCTTGTSYNVGLNAGTASGATVTSRLMSSGANRLGYALYTDSARTTNWGNTPGTDTSAQTTASTTPSTFTVYGRIPALQNVPAGSYTDTVTVTVNY